MPTPKTSPAFEITPTGYSFCSPGDTATAPGPDGWIFHLQLDRDEDADPRGEEAFSDEQIADWVADLWCFVRLSISATKGDQTIDNLAGLGFIPSDDADPYSDRHIEILALETLEDAAAELSKSNPAPARLPDGWAIARRGLRIVVADAYGVALGAADMTNDTPHGEAVATREALACALANAAAAAGAPTWVERACSALGWTPPQVADAWASGDLAPPPDVRGDVVAYIDSILWARGFGHRLPFAAN